jgi:hypothetical protein
MQRDAYETGQLRKKLDQRRVSLGFWEHEADLGIPGFSVAEHRGRLAAEIADIESALEARPDDGAGGSTQRP